MVGQAITSVLQVIICPTISKNSRTGYAPPKNQLNSLNYFEASGRSSHNKQGLIERLGSMVIFKKNQCVSNLSKY